MALPGYTDGLSPSALRLMALAQKHIEEYGAPGEFPVCPCCRMPLDAAHDKTSCGTEA